MGEREDGLIDALQDAYEGLREMFPYVPDYFVDKWGLQGYIDRAEAALRAARRDIGT